MSGGGRLARAARAARLFGRNGGFAAGAGETPAATVLLFYMYRPPFGDMI